VSDLFGAFRAHNRDVRHDLYEVWIERPLEVQQATILEEPLKDLVDKWIELWRKIGGTKEILKRVGQEPDDSDEA
jgi:hypothetical protein